ncbi:MAG TPA: hypothetical protein VH206_03215 [Xanthobacteraceae bacterium]|nr:hypothetical protein [Xanthobacteraceae bacterium]
MKKIAQEFAVTLIAMAVIVGPAFAQQDKGPPTSRSSSESKRDAEIDRAYRESVKRNNVDLPKQTKTDPWGDLRPAAENSKPDTVKK